MVVRDMASLRCGRAPGGGHGRFKGWEVYVDVRAAVGCLLRTGERGPRIALAGGAGGRAVGRGGGGRRVE